MIEIIQGKTTVAKASRSCDLSPSETEGWLDDAKRGMENSLRINPLKIREQHQKQLKDLQEAEGEAMRELRARKNIGPCWMRRITNAPELPAGLLAEGISVPLTELCARVLGCRAGHCITG